MKKGFIARLGSFLGIDLLFFVRNGFWVSASQVVGMVAGLLLSVAFARLVSQELYGQYQYVIALFGLFSVLSLPGLNLSVIQSFVGGHTGSLDRAVKISFFSSLIAVPCIVGIGIYQMLHGQTELGVALVVGGIFFPGTHATNTWRSVFEARKQFKDLAVRLIIIQIIFAGVMIMTLWSGRGLVALVAMYALSYTILHLYYFMRVRDTRAGASKDLDVWFGVRVSMQKFTHTLTSTLPAILFSYFYSYDAVAHFSIALFLMTFMGTFANTGLSIYRPWMISLKSMRGNLGRVLVYNGGLGIGMFVVFFVGIRLFFFALYGEGYASSFAILGFTSFVVILFPIRAFFMHYLTVKGNNFFMITINLIAHALGVVALILLRDHLSFVHVAAIYYFLIGGFAVVFMVARVFYLDIWRGSK